MTKQEAEKFLGKEVAVTVGETDDEVIAMRGKLTKVTDEVIQLDDNEDELCEWKLSDIDTIELLTPEWNQPFAWLKDVK